MYEDSKQYAINYYCRDYDDIVSTINGFSDEEIGLIIDNLPDDYDNLQNAICEEIEAGIIQILCDNLVTDLDDKSFYECFEGDIIDNITGGGLSYESCGYCINLYYYTDWFDSLIYNSEYKDKFEINSELNKYEFINSLNQLYTSIKFYI